MKPTTKVLTVLAMMIGINLMLSLTIEVPHSNHGNVLPINGLQFPSRDASASSSASSASPVNITDEIYRVVFFNVYINPTTVTRYRASLAIIDEQLNSIPNNTHVYYYLIGRQYRRNICRNYPNLHCTRMAYAESGGEELTLHAMWSYCREHSSHRVTYLHDKGSYRPSIGNTRNRQRATRGALSTECLSMSSMQCNICGSKLQVMPFMIYQANMWTAECSYLRQLAPPANYTTMRQALLETMYAEHDCLAQSADITELNVSLAWNLTDPLFLRNVGLGRYALERWIMNHPSVRPCEVWPHGVIGMHSESKLMLGFPSEWGKMVNKKIKARQSWMLQREYETFYPHATINDFLVKDQSKPKPRPCWS
jgi:hypothetical protein